MPERKRLSVIPKSLLPALKIKAHIADELLECSSPTLSLEFVHWDAWMPILVKLSNNFCVTDTNRRLKFSLFPDV